LYCDQADRIITCSAEGKLWTEQEAMRFDVDRVTLKRTPTTDKLPLFVAKESDPG
jgi:hypothetical protein